MSTIELRHIISEHLSHIDDDSFLNAIKTIIESKLTTSTYKTSAFQKNRLESARNEFETGNSIADEVVHNEIEQWLNTK